MFWGEYLLFYLESLKTPNLQAGVGREFFRPKNTAFGKLELIFSRRDVHFTSWTVLNIQFLSQGINIQLNKCSAQVFYSDF